MKSNHWWGPAPGPIPFPLQLLWRLAPTLLDWILLWMIVRDWKIVRDR